MLTHDLVGYVSDLDLQPPAGRFAVTRGAEATSIKAGTEQAFLTDKSLVSFIADVSGQNRSDVLNSTLLAQMAANKMFPNEADLLDWYKTFIEVLSNIGWEIETAEISTYESANDVFEVEDVILDILASAFGASFIPIIKKILESLKTLNSKDHKIIAFEKNTHSLTKGCFQIALADEKNNSVSMQLGTFLITSTNIIKQILFFKSTKDTTKLQYTSRRGTLNTDAYALVRDVVLQKIGGNISAFVTEIDI